MYERFHGLRERPFSLSPDPDYLYPSRVHKEALSYLRYGIEGHAGFIVITGEVGSGKTTLLQTALRTLDRQTSVARLVNTMLDARDLLEAIMLDFGLDPGNGRSKPHLLRDLARYLVDQRSAGRLCLLVIDEAQNLNFSALEEVRMLSNLETEKSKLIQIALIGQPNLRDVLQRPELEQLKQRVTVNYHLQALDALETAAYVNHRLRRAAIAAPIEFPPEVTRLIHEHSQGIPRKINVIADAVLLFAYGDDQHTITETLTREVLAELEGVRAIATPPASAATPTTTPPAANATPALATAPASTPAAVTAASASALTLAPSPSALPTELPPLSPATPQRELRAPFAAPSGRLVTADPDPFIRPLAIAPLAGPSNVPLRYGATPSSRPTVAARSMPPAARRREPEGVWSRLRRSLFSSSKPAYED